MEILQNNYHAIMIAILCVFLLINPLVRYVVGKFLFLAIAMTVLIYVVRYVSFQ